MSVRSDEQNIIAARNREIAKLREENQRLELENKKLGTRLASDMLVAYGAEILEKVERQAKIEVLLELVCKVDKLRDGEGVSIEHAYELTVCEIRKQLEGE